MNGYGPTEAQMADVFLGPIDTSTDWMLPLWQQPSYASQFPEGTFASTLPEPAPRTGGWDWLDPITQPFVNFGESFYKAAEPAVAATYEKLPELLWGWGLERSGIIDRPKEIPVNEGAGVVVTHVQPPHAGGEPAKPLSVSIPQVFPTWGAAGAPAADMKTVLWIGAGLTVLYLMIGRK